MAVVRHPVLLLYRGQLSSCNYSCSYCPFSKTSDSRESLARDQQALNRFVRWVAGQQREFRILFTPWGEALIRSYYQEAIASLTQLPNIRRVAIQTNLSMPVSAVAKLNNPALALWVTYHPSQTRPHLFLEKCKQLYRSGIRFSVGAVGNRDELEALQWMRRKLPPDVYMWININREQQGSYSDDDWRMIRMIDPHVMDNARIYQSYQSPCKTGTEAFSVNQNGDLFRCHFVSGRLGNVYQDGLPETTAPCPNKTCDCHIGYIHMPHLKLYEKYGDGLAERIPDDFFWDGAVRK